MKCVYSQILSLLSRIGINGIRFKYTYLVLTCVFIWYIFGYKSIDGSSSRRLLVLKFLNEKEAQSGPYLDAEFISHLPGLVLNKKENKTKCGMDTCFDYPRCSLNDFKIFIYSQPNLIASSNYKKIIDILSNSKYTTKTPEKACLFISSVDTLDRDKLSVNYVKNLKKLMPKLDYWNYTGTNHVIFNLYSGSWPTYAEDLGFDPMHAILIKASFSIKNYRKNFDVSLPLFHSDLPFNETFHLPQNENILLKKKYLLTFKGKVKKVFSNFYNSI